MVSGKAGKVGRPPRTEADQIRTIAWFNFVQIALETDKPTGVGRHVQMASDALGPKGRSGNLEGSNQWSRYAKGIYTPREDLISFIDEIVPGSSEVFWRGPNDLWIALWEENEFRLQCEDIEDLFLIEPTQIDLHWFSRTITAWRRRASIAHIGVLDNFPDGLYEAIMLGLNLPAVKLPLERLKVWELISEKIRSAERQYLLRDFEKTKEILTMGRYFLKLGNPIESYLLDPVGFSINAMEAKDFAAPPGFGKLIAVPI